jgi:hypothetical protein
MDNLHKLKYEILPDLKLIVDSWVGDVTYNDIIECKINQAKNEKWDINYNILSDVRYSIMILSDDELIKLSNYPTFDKRFNSPRKIAHFTHNPKQVVFQKLLELYRSEFVQVNFKAFSTLDYSLEYLEINLIQKKRIEKILFELLKDR